MHLHPFGACFGVRNASPLQSWIQAPTMRLSQSLHGSDKMQKYQCPCQIESRELECATRWRYLKTPHCLQSDAVLEFEYGRWEVDCQVRLFVVPQVAGSGQGGCALGPHRGMHPPKQSVNAVVAIQGSTPLTLVDYGTQNLGAPFRCESRYQAETLVCWTPRNPVLVRRVGGAADEVLLTMIRRIVWRRKTLDWRRRDRTETRWQ
jgi:hypothetical protein